MQRFLYRALILLFGGLLYSCIYPSFKGEVVDPAIANNSLLSPKKIITDKITTENSINKNEMIDSGEES